MVRPIRADMIIVCMKDKTQMLNKMIEFKCMSCFMRPCNGIFQ